MKQHMKLTYAACLALALAIGLHVGFKGTARQSQNGYVQMYQRDVNECQQEVSGRSDAENEFYQTLSRSGSPEAGCSAQALDRIERLPFDQRTAARAAVETYLRSGQ